MLRSRSIIAIPPGETIKEQLIDKDMNQKEFAVRMDMSEKHISRLINGEVQLTPDVAVRLEVVLGPSARFWNNLEAIYREKIAKIEAESAMEGDVEIVKNFPYAEMANLGWVDKTRDNKEKVVNLRRYFEVVKLPLIEKDSISKIACRRLAITEKSDLALLAWAQKVKLESRGKETSLINIKKLIRLIPKIREMTVQDPKAFCPELVSDLSECGIALVFVPHLKGSFLQGATFINGHKIVIGMTTRGRDADKFWFSLFHELGHIVLGHVYNHGGTSKEDEDAADKWARDTLIPPEAFEAFKDNNDYSRKSVLGFSEKQGIAPGIVVGRMQREGMIKYTMLNDLKEKYDFLSD